MGINDNIFKKEKTSRLLFRFAIPLVISLLVAEFYNLVDTIFVGRYIGANAIGALTIAFPIQRLLFALGMLIAVGTSTLVSRNLGEKNYDNLKEGISNAFGLTVIILFLVSFTVFIFKKPIIYKLGASDTIYPLVNKYVTIILLGGVFQALSVVGSYIMTSLGNTKITLYCNLVGAVCNIILDFILVSVFHIGISGAAIATVVSQIISFIFVAYKFRIVTKTFKINFSISLDWKIAVPIIGVGFSSFIVEISDAIDSAMLNNLLLSKGGDTAIIIIGVVTKLSMFMYITIIGISAAMQPIIAYNYGAENYKKMKDTLKVSIITVIIASLSFWVIFMLFAKPMIGFFLKDSVILPQSVKAFRVCILLLPLVSLYYIGIYYYQAIGESKKSFLLSIYRQIIVFIPVAYVLITTLGVTGAWIAYPVTDVISSLTSIYFIKKATSEEFDKSFDDRHHSLVKIS